MRLISGELDASPPERGGGVRQDLEDLATARVGRDQRRKKGAGRRAGGGQGNGKGDRKRQFTAEELKDLFTLDTDTDCVTRDVLTGKKKTGGRARLSFGSSPAGKGDRWEDVSSTSGDGPVRAMVEGGDVTFVKVAPGAEVEEEPGVKPPPTDEGVEEEPVEFPDVFDAPAGGDGLGGAADGVDELDVSEDDEW